MVIRAHHLPGWIPQSLARAHSMGVGVFVLRQGRTLDHTQFSVGTQAASLTDNVMLSEAKHL